MLLKVGPIGVRWESNNPSRKCVRVLSGIPVLALCPELHSDFSLDNSQWACPLLNRLPNTLPDKAWGSTPCFHYQPWILCQVLSLQDRTERKSKGKCLSTTQCHSLFTAACLSLRTKQTATVSDATLPLLGAPDLWIFFKRYSYCRWRPEEGISKIK